MVSHLRLLPLTLACSLATATGQRPVSESQLAQRRQDYALLAENVVPGLSDGSKGEPARLEAAAAEAKERWRVVVLDTLESEDRRIRAVAKEAAEAHAELLKLVKASGDEELIVDLALALFFETPTALLRSLGRSAEQEMDYATRYAKAVQRRRSGTFLLPELAKELAGPHAEAAPVSIDFDENWFGSEPDRLNLTNVSRREWTRCTVQVDIRGRDDQWVRNVHFVSSWPVGQKLWADYATHDASQLAAISGTTAIEVLEVKVSLWCDQLRAEEVRLKYPGPARDEDRLRQLEKLLAFEIDYVSEPFFESGPCVGVRLKGVTRLPACKLMVWCRGGNAIDQRLELELQSWEAGSRVSLQSRGSLNSCPKSFDVVIELTGSEVKVTKSGVMAGRMR